MSAADWTAPFASGDMLKAPKRGQGEPSAAVLLIGRLTYGGITLAADAAGIRAHPAELLTAEDRAAIQEHRAELLAILGGQQPPRLSLDKQAQAEKDVARGFIGREPTAKETDEAQTEARALLKWLRQSWHGTMTEPTFFDELEAELYRVGVLSLCWALDVGSLRELLAELRKIEDVAGAEFQAAMHRAQARESTEWHALNIAAAQLSRQATEMSSPRLEKAAALLVEMLTPDRIRPEAPAVAARKESSKKANDARRAPEKAVWEKIDSTMQERLKYLRGRGAKKRAAEGVARQALYWNREEGSPLKWETEEQAVRAILVRFTPSQKARRKD